MSDDRLARRGARDLLVRALYQWQLTDHDLDELLAQFSAHEDFSSCDQDYFRALLPLIIADAAALDAVIAQYAARGLDQLDRIGRAVLLLALTEIKQRPDVPLKVVINEAVELAKRYGAADSYRFVNAVLDKAAHELRAARKKAGD